MKNRLDLLSQNVGVDVSKDTLDAVLSTMDMQQQVKVKASRRFANTPAGFRQLHKWVEGKRVKQVPLRVLMEATGIYYEQLAWFLYEKEYAVSVILPTKAKRYIQAVGNKSKNDRIDAMGLARMGLEQRLPLWQPLSRMSKKGNAHIRRAMHLPAFGVVRWKEPAFAALYERLMARGKTKMQAYVAVQRKLLILVWALWRKDEAYDPKYGQKGEAEGASGNGEQKSHFSLACEEGKKEVAPAIARATQDERQCNTLPEALISLPS